ncbi:MAG TPA: hypothetical protein VHZ33_24570 [Trebonia sp.]|nr:hypothetical protein [Trebonia sp.]
MPKASAARVASSTVAVLAVVASGLAGAGGSARAGTGAGVSPLPGADSGGIISTVAGGVGGPGPATSVAMSPCGLRMAGGSLYIGDDSTVRRVSAATDALTTVAGDWATGPADDSGAAVSASLGGACGSAVDGAGNLVVATTHVVQVIPARTGTFYGQQMTADHLYTVAGVAGEARDSRPLGDRGPATSATFENAVDVAIDRAGNLVISDSGSARGCLDCRPLGSLVRVVATRAGAFYGQKMRAGDIYTVAGVQNLAPAGNGGPATSAWLGTAIGSVRPDRAGNLVLADNGENDRSGVVAPSVRVIAAATGTFYGQKMTAGHIYRIAGNGRTGTAGNGGLASKASLMRAGGIAVDGAGNVVVGDQNEIRVIAARTERLYGLPMTAHHIYAVAGTGKAGDSGDGGLAERARISAGAVALDASGNVLLADPLRVRVVAARSGTFYGRTMTARHIYTVAGNGLEFSGDGRPALLGRLPDPHGVSVDGAGAIAISDDTSDVVDLIPARSGVSFGRPMKAGNLYTVAGDGDDGFKGDGGPARKAEFGLLIGTSVAFDRSGNLVVADAENSRVRLVAVRSGRFYGQSMTAGDVYTIAGSGVRGFSGDGGPAVKAHLGLPGSAGVDHHGNLLIVDNSRIRVVAASTGRFYGQKMAAGDIYTVAGGGTTLGDGGPAVKASIGAQSVTVDAAGNLIVDDLGRIRVVAVQTGTMYGHAMTAGDIYTIAGGSEKGAPSGSGGPAVAASFTIGGVAVDHDGNVVLADWPDSVVWVVAVRTGAFYGQTMTAGDIYIVAGGGATLGDGSPAASASLRYPFAVAVSSSGSLLVTDSGDHRLREITVG